MYSYFHELHISISQMGDLIPFTVITVTAPNSSITFSSTFWNDNTHSNVLLDDDASCFLSGYEVAPWWKVKLPQVTNIKKVKIYSKEAIISLVVCLFVFLYSHIKYGTLKQK